MLHAVGGAQLRELRLLRVEQRLESLHRDRTRAVFAFCVDIAFTSAERRTFSASCSLPSSMPRRACSTLAFFAVVSVTPVRCRNAVT